MADRAGGDARGGRQDQAVQVDRRTAELDHFVAHATFHRFERRQVKALGLFQQPGRHPVIEVAAEDLPGGVLAPQEAAVADVMVVIQRFHQGGDVRGRMLKVIVHGDDDPATAFAQAGKDGHVLADVLAQVQRPDPGMGTGQFAGHLPGAVRTTVIDQDQFQRITPADGGIDGGDQRGQSFLAAISRDDD
ncbi:hypothetical protein D3C81_1366840 [compost metagenome]